MKFKYKIYKIDNGEKKLFDVCFTQKEIQQKLKIADFTVRYMLRGYETAYDNIYQIEKI